MSFNRRHYIKDGTVGWNGSCTCPEELITKTVGLLEKRLRQISQLAPAFPAALRSDSWCLYAWQ